MQSCIIDLQYTESICSFTFIVCSYSGKKPQNWPIMVYSMQKNVIIYEK